MKLTLANLETVDLALGELMKEKLPIITSFKLTRFVKNNFSKELVLFLEMRREIAKKYCKRDDKNQPIIENNAYQFEQENEVKANKEMIELLKQEVTFDFEPLAIESFGNINISPQSLITLIDLGFIENEKTESGE